MFYRWVQKLGDTFVTSGCAVGLYYPDDPVTRGQMAIFISRAAFNGLFFAGYPRLLSVVPNQASPGDAVMVVISGSGVAFSDSGIQPTGVADVDGVSVQSVSVGAPDTLFVDLLIAPDATPGPRSIITSTNGVEAVFPNGFAILPPSP